MNVQVIKCPACNGSLNLNTNGEFVVCQYCNNTIQIKRRNVNQDGSISFIDKATNLPLGTAVLPFGYQTIGMIVPNLSTNVYPITLSCSGYNNKGAVVTFFSGEGFTDSSKCPMLTGPYSTVVNQISRIQFRNFMEAEAYADGYMNHYASSSKANSLTCVGQREYPLYGGFNRAESMEIYKRRVAINLQRQGFDTSVVLGYYQKPVCRIYRMEAQGNRYLIALALVLEGVKYKVEFPGMNMGFGFGFGGLFGRNQSAPNAAPQGAFGNMAQNQVIDWQSNGVYMLQSFENTFEEDYKGAFTDMCSTFKVDPGITEKTYNMQMKMFQDVANYTQQNIAQQQRQFAAWQEINRTMQSAYDSYNQAWWDRNNSSYQASRARYQSSGGSSSPDFSEAIRGVNTYLRDDGTEVEVSVAYDRAYTNNLGDTMGSNSAFEPGGNWTEMRRI